MYSSWINEVAITTGIAIIAFGWLWLWLCFKGMVNFPRWMVNLFPGYNLKRAWRQAERKLRWAEKRRKYWESKEAERYWGYQWISGGKLAVPEKGLFPGLRPLHINALCGMQGMTIRESKEKSWVD